MSHGAPFGPAGLIYPRPRRLLTDDGVNQDSANQAVRIWWQCQNRRRNRGPAAQRESRGVVRLVGRGSAMAHLVDAENLWSSNGQFADDEPAGRANGVGARLAVRLVTAHREIWAPNKCSYRGTCCGLPSAASGCWRFSRGPKVVAFLR